MPWHCWKVHSAEPTGKTIQCLQTGEFNLLKAHYVVQTRGKETLRGLRCPCGGDRTSPPPSWCFQATESLSWDFDECAVQWSVLPQTGNSPGLCLDIKSQPFARKLEANTLCTQSDLIKGWEVGCTMWGHTWRRVPGGRFYGPSEQTVPNHMFTCTDQSQHWPLKWTRKCVRENKTQNTAMKKTNFFSPDSRKS